MSTMISRRRFLGTVGATAVAAGGLSELFANESAKDNIRLGMMLQGGSAAELRRESQGHCRRRLREGAIDLLLPPDRGGAQDTLPDPE